MSRCLGALNEVAQGIGPADTQPLYLATNIE